MAFTAQDVKKLREMTNVGMMDCKKALQATDGDMDAAIDWLREKGLAKAAKKADRIAAEGVAFATVVNGVGVVIEVNSETDFAAKTDAVSLLSGLGQTLFTEPVNSLVHITVGSGQGCLAVHHTNVGHLAESLNILSGKCHDLFPPIISCV